MPDIDSLVALALDLTAALSSEDRYQRLLDLAGRIIPCDASALLRLDGEVLVPLAATGLVPQAMGRRFPLDEHPRLEVICRSDGPVRFPPDSALPDPFDGLVGDGHTGLGDVHSCLGCPLTVADELVGVLTADALRPGAFDTIDQRVLVLLSALAGAALRTSQLIEALEDEATRQGRVARDLMRDALTRGGGELIGTSRPMARLRDEIALVARSELTVLITGETGVGKELVARAVQRGSTRSGAALIYVNCAALPESVAESELFGHVRGAFTGAESDRPGKFEVADGGTLFLDEIGELPLSVQPKLLRVLQEGEIQRVGADHPSSVDVRVLAATNRDLTAEVKRGSFRADLYHRLAVYELRVPPLREHIEDVAILGGHFCDEMRRRLGLGPVRLSADAIAVLERHSWPGNVRELDNLLSRATLRASRRVKRGQSLVLDGADLHGDLDDDSTPVSPVAPAGADASSSPLSLSMLVDDFRRRTIREAVERNAENWAAAAKELGMHRSNLHRLAHRLGLR